MQKTITVPGVGLVLITKKTNASRIKLRIHPQKGVLVTIPYFAKFSEAERFVNQNISWLQEKLAAQTEKKKLKGFSPDSVFRTRKYTLVFVEHEKAGLKAVLKENTITIFYNKTEVDFDNDAVQTFIQKFIIKALKAEGEVYLKKRIAEISVSCGIHHKSVRVGTAGSRLGSCSSKNDIILSCRLMLLPDDLIDYIILHELSHVIHKNHSERFHDLLNKLAEGKSKDLNKSLKKHSISITPGDFCYQDS